MDTGKFQAKTRRVQVANTCLDKPVVIVVAEDQQKLFARPAFRTHKISFQPPLAFYPPLLPLFYGLLNLRRNLRFAEMVEIAPRMDLAFGRNFPPSSPLRGARRSWRTSPTKKICIPDSDKPCNGWPTFAPIARKFDSIRSNHDGRAQVSVVVPVARVTRSTPPIVHGVLE